MEYWEMDIWKVNEFNLLNEEIEEFPSRSSQNMINIRSPSHSSSKKLLNVCEA